jgi:hypothetical protein
MNKSVQVAVAITTGVYSSYYTLSFIKDDCERQRIRQQQPKLKDIMAKNQEVLHSVVKNSEKLNVK